MYTSLNVNDMTEQEIEAELNLLGKKLKDRQATPRQADRYDDLQRALKRIQDTRRGRRWL